MVVTDAHKKQSKKTREGMKSKTTRKNWLIKLVNGLAFTSTNSGKNNTQSFNQVTDSSDTSRPNCRTILYKHFIDAYCENDFSNVGGKSNWFDVLIEYSELIKTEKSENIFKAWMRIEENNFKIEATEFCMDILRVNYSPAAAEWLTLFGFGFVENLDDHDAYLKQLDIIETESKMFVVLQNQLEIQYQQMIPERAKDIDKSRMSFEKDLAVLKKQGYGIDKNTQTVFEYCAAVNALIDEQKINKNGRSKI